MRWWWLSDIGGDGLPSAEMMEISPERGSLDELEKEHKDSETISTYDGLIIYAHVQAETLEEAKLVAMQLFTTQYG